MKHLLLEKLLCPKTGKKLVLEAPEIIGDEIENGCLVSVDGEYRYPIRNGIPRFVPEENYANNFGMQWNHFRHTQLDSYSGHPISANRFWGATGWLPDNIKGQWVLDVGCGAGRFAEVALDAGAKVLALDYSSAVDACYANLKHHPNLHVVQGDIYALPFEQEAFPFVYSLGVLQHTPDVAKAFAALPRMVAAEGRLCVDYYQKSWKSIFHIKYWLRPVTKRIPNPVLFSILQAVVPILLPVSRFLGGVPLIGGGLKRLLPVVNYYKEFPLDNTQHKEWSILDTFDWLSPEHDHPQTAKTAREWMRQI
jgi:2-polyprenyl-3-methyl-5-hydroxy-6-metoxy-1,4-benzoquinol methylase